AATRDPGLVAGVRTALAGGHVESSVAAAAPAPAPSPASETTATSSPSPKSTQSAWTPVAPGATSRLNDDQKRALAAADKKHEAEQEKRHAERAKHAARKHGKTGSPFHKGGDAHDPLNSSL